MMDADSWKAGLIGGRYAGIPDFVPSICLLSAKRAAVSLSSAFILVSYCSEYPKFLDLLMLSLI